MSISIVTSMYNKSPAVLETIDSLFFPSLLNNASSDKQLIIVDDASPAKKETELLLEKYIPEFNKKFGEVKIVRNEKNLGFGGSYNRGIMQAEGNSIVVTNDDVYFPLNSVDKLTKILSENNSYGMIGPITNENTTFTYQYCKQAPQIKSYSADEIKRIEKFAVYASNKMRGTRIPTDLITGFCFAMPKDLIREMKGFDERFKYGLYEDTDLARRVYQNHSVIIAPDVYIHHGGIKGASGSTSQFPLKKIRAMTVNQYKYGQKWNDHLGAMKHLFLGLYRMKTGKKTVSELFE
jgi:O-antigen biosynthesis protein